MVLTTENQDSEGWYTTGWGATSATGEDTGSAAGWSIADGHRIHLIPQNPPLSSPWVSSPESITLRIAIKGTVVGGTTPSTDATLSGLTVTAGSTDLMLTPTFVSGTYVYAASVGNTVTEVTVTPTKNDSGATIVWLDGSDMTLADANASETGQQVTLVEGDNVINVKVTAADGSTTLTYAVTVNRAAAMTPTCTLNTGDLWCGVVTVGAVEVFGTTVSYGFADLATDIGALSNTGFSVGTNSYAIDSVTIGIDSNAGLLYFGLTSALTDADQAKLVLHVGSDSFAFSAATGPDSNQAYRWSSTGLDWSSTSSVTLRLREAAPAVSTDATLSALAVNDGSRDLTLRPGFASGMYAYAASVASTVAEVTVTPTKNDSGATIVWLDGSDMTLADANASETGQQVTLVEGDNVINVKVTAADGSTTLTYAVTVNRAAAMTPTCTLNTGDLWCGVVTVGAVEVFGTTVSYGFADLATDIGALSNTGFSVGTNSYAIDSVTIEPLAKSLTPRVGEPGSGC